MVRRLREQVRPRTLGATARAGRDGRLPRLRRKLLRHRRGYACGRRLDRHRRTLHPATLAGLTQCTYVRILRVVCVTVSSQEREVSLEGGGDERFSSAALPWREGPRGAAGHDLALRRAARLVVLRCGCVLPAG